MVIFYFSAGTRNQNGHCYSFHSVFNSLSKNGNDLKFISFFNVNYTPQEENIFPLLINKNLSISFFSSLLAIKKVVNYYSYKDSYFVIEDEVSSILYFLFLFNQKKNKSFVYIRYGPNFKNIVKLMICKILFFLFSKKYIFITDSESIFRFYNKILLIKLMPIPHS
jgi:hypothetical protein